jgi:hypothetical protein
MICSQRFSVASEAVLPLAFVREFKLAGPRGDGRHPYVNGDGAFIGRGVPLLERDVFGRWKPRDGAVLERLLTEGYGVPVALGWRATQLGYVAEALSKGDLVLASISLVHAELPPLPSAGHARAMAKADGLLLKFNPDWEDEPRIPKGDPAGGQWTSDGGSGAVTELVSDRGEDVQSKKEHFVDAHLADAQVAADELGVPVENILGVSAVESGWGESRFAVQGNNYFGIHYPAPFAVGYTVSKKGSVKVAMFASHADSLRSFVAIAGADVHGVSDPGDFAAALHDTGKFGVGNANYAQQLGATIKGLRTLVSQHTI